MNRLFTIVAMVVSLTSSAQTIIDFDDVLTETDTFYVGQDGGTSFTTNGFDFPTEWNSSWAYWSAGIGVSNVVDVQTAGYTNAYASIAGSGYQSDAYGVLFYPELPLGDAYRIAGMYVTNGTYPTKSMEDGDSFSKKFGGASGDDEDWFKVVFHGFNNGVKAADSVEFYLADYRFVDNAQDYIVKDWTWVDLTKLGVVDSLSVTWHSSDVGQWGINTPHYLMVDDITLYDPNCTIITTKVPSDSGPIASDSTLIKSWATQASALTRGWLDAGNESLVVDGESYASFGEADNAVGSEVNSTHDVVSLGDGGSIVLSFEGEIFNGPGPDFAVFENAAVAGFLELAFVEVSSDGVNFVRFPSVSHTQTCAQVGGFGTLEADSLYNLAGKYQLGYGVPFDLEDLVDSLGIDLDKITHVRIVDVVGAVNEDFGSHDSEGNFVNDPYPTPFSTGGFDLAGVAAINIDPTFVTGVNTIASQNQRNFYDYSSGQLILDELATGNKTISAIEAGTGKVIKQLSVYDEYTVSAQELFANSKGSVVVQVADSKGLESFLVLVK